MVGPVNTVWVGLLGQARAICHL